MSNPSTTMSQSPWRWRWRPSLKWIGLIIPFLAIFGISRFVEKSNFENVFDSIELLSFSTLGLLAIVMLQNLFQGLRFWSLFPKYTHTRTVIQAFIYGQAINSVIPARVGDFAKLAYLNRTHTSLPVAKGIGLLVSDKIIETVLFIILFFVALNVGAAFLPTSNLLSSWESKLGIVFIIGLSLFLWRKFYRKSFDKLRTGVGSLTNSYNTIFSLVFGILAWGAEVLCLILVAQQFGLSIDISQGILCIVLLNIGISVPVSLANVGPYEAALSYGLTCLGFSIPVSIAVATIHHGLQVLAPWVLLGILRVWNWLAKRQKSTPLSMDSKEKAIQYYANKASQGYEKTVNNPILGSFRSLERGAVYQLIGTALQGKRAIDVGCGEGIYSKYLKNAGCHVTATDVVPKMLESVRPFVDESLLSDIETIEHSKQYDLVVCAGVMDFVKKPDAAFLNLSKLLAPGGRLVVLTPRKGLGGVYYRIEKFVEGVQVNLHSLDWFKEQALQTGLTVKSVLFPLPTNMAICFEK